MRASYKYAVIGEAHFGGFDAELLEGETTIFVRAHTWKGRQQPRIVLDHHDNGFADWLKLMSPVKTEVEFPTHTGFADNLFDQWLVH